VEKTDPPPNERKLFEALSALKAEADLSLSRNGQLLTNPAFAEREMLRLIVEQLKTKHQLPLTAESSHFIKSLVMKEYLDEFHGLQPSA
jgi:type I restriction enzyme R subunit